jgi:hypothetical protein
MVKRGKKAQVAIFVIIALVIVAAVIIIFLYPRISEFVAPAPVAPEGYLESCLQPVVKANVALLASQGGYKNPEGFITYNGTKVKYLCYTSKYYETCSVQQPMIVTHFAEELAGLLKPEAEKCADSLKADYERRGYEVSMSGVRTNISLAPGKVVISFTAPMTILKEDVKRTFEKFDVGIKSNIYDLMSIATSIVEFEAYYGDSETTTYIQYYPDLRIYKIKTEDGSKIYIVSDIITDEKFVFASRSLVWPAGYGGV